MSRDIRWWLKVACVLVLIGGALLTAWNVQREDNIQRNNLLISARIAAHTIIPEEVEALEGSDADLASPVYQHIKRIMMGVASADSKIRFAYLMGMQEGGNIFFFVDSEPPDSDDYSPPGQIYWEATAPTRAAFASGEESTAGPASDRWGTWVSAFIPVRDPDTGDLIGIFGLDVDARDWFAILIGAAVPPILATGLIIMLLISFLVVQERNQKERELLTSSQRAIERSEQRYRLLFTHSPVGIIQIDTQGRIAMANVKCAELLGVSPDDLIGFDIRTQLRHPELRSAIQAIPLGKPAYFEGEYQSVGSDKTSFVRILVHPLMLGENEYAGAIAIIEDISERKRTEEALIQANKKLNLLNNITRHDILNQLLALKGYLELSSEMGMDPRAPHQFIEKAKKAADNIERHIKFTRDYQDMGVRTATWQPIGMGIARARGALALEHLSIRMENIEYEIFADPLFEKVFYNLLQNSIKHGGEHLTTIRISARETEQGLLIIYEDDGIGIPAEMKQTLFAQELTPQRGLGMFLAGQILAITGISIEETGVPGKGARFEIRVPNGAFRREGAAGP